MYFCTLVELPSIIEAQKTLDFKTFYKSLDVCQMLYVHNDKIEDVTGMSPQEMMELGQKFIPYQKDPKFKDNLFKRSDIKKGGIEYSDEWLPYKYRHGLTPPMKNARNVRFKKEQTLEEKLANKEEVKNIQKILQDII